MIGELNSIGAKYVLISDFLHRISKGGVLHKGPNYFLFKLLVITTNLLIQTNKTFENLNTNHFKIFTQTFETKNFQANNISKKHLNKLSQILINITFILLQNTNLYKGRLVFKVNPCWTIIKFMD